MNRHTQESIVLRLFPALGLFSSNHANQAHLHQAADVGRYIHQHQDVDGVAIAAQRRGNEPKVKWELHALWQKAAQLEETGPWIVGKLFREPLGVSMIARHVE